MSKGYKIYQTMRTHIFRTFRKHMSPMVTKQMKCEMRSPGFSDELIREFFTFPGACQTLDAAVMMDEFQWERLGGSIFFPESTDLLNLLWRSKMKIDPEYLEEFPESFVISWPKGTVIEGRELPPVLISYASFDDREWMFNAFRDKYLSPAITRHPSPAAQADQKNLHMSYHDEEQKGPNGEFMWVRCSVPKDRVDRLLKSEEVLHEMGGYVGIGVHELDDGDIKLQWILSRMVLQLLVYMQACPESVIPGWPDKVKERDVKMKYGPKLKPSVIGSPVINKGEGHASPEAHWRNCHLRSYPRRKDGTRQKGVVFVTGCLVNAEVDPKTVVKVAKRI